MSINHQFTTTFILHHHPSLNWNMLPQLTNESEFSQPDSSLIVTMIAERTFTPGTSGNNSGKQRIVTCYNCKGEGHISKQCTKPRRKRDDLWFKNKVLLVQAQASGQILHEEELTFLADPGIPEVALMANLSHYGSDDLAETLLLAEESRSKMLLRQKDPIMLKKKVNTTPVDYAALNQLYKDFKTCFVPQTELSAKQAFWSQNSVKFSKN
ncbi:integrase, catalytic region, zinc finger, CCHC-type containing protein [Tanacetum coccineum]